MTVHYELPRSAPGPLWFGASGGTTIRRLCAQFATSAGPKIPANALVASSLNKRLSPTLRDHVAAVGRRRGAVWGGGGVVGVGAAVGRWGVNYCVCAAGLWATIGE